MAGQSNIEQSFGVIPILRQGNQLKFLLIQHNSGHWAFPKGHAESGEREIESARRELLEETGIKAVQLQPLPVFLEEYNKRRGGSTILKIVKYWIGFVADMAVNIQLEEIRDYKWATHEEARATITFSQSRALLEEVVAHLNASPSAR